MSTSPSFVPAAAWVAGASVAACVAAGVAASVAACVAGACVAGAWLAGAWVAGGAAPPHAANSILNTLITPIKRKMFNLDFILSPLEFGQTISAQPALFFATPPSKLSNKPSGRFNYSGQKIDVNRQFPNCTSHPKANITIARKPLY